MGSRQFVRVDMSRLSTRGYREGDSVFVTDAEEGPQPGVYLGKGRTRRGREGFTVAVNMGASAGWVSITVDPADVAPRTRPNGQTGEAQC